MLNVHVLFILDLRIDFNFLNTALILFILLTECSVLLNSVPKVSTSQLLCPTEGEFCVVPVLGNYEYN